MKDLSDETPIWLPNMTPQLEFAFATKVTVNPARNIGNLHGSGERLIMTVGAVLSQAPYPGKSCPAALNGRWCALMAWTALTRGIRLKPTMAY